MGDKLKIELVPSFRGGLLSIDHYDTVTSRGEEIRTHICQSRISLFNECVRDSLIKLGWTPPPE